MTRWTIKEKERALDLYRTGVAPSEISRMTGIPVTTIQDWRRQAGIPADRAAHTPLRSSIEFRALVHRLYYDEHMSPGEIGEKLGRPETSIDYYLRRTGARRSHGEALKLSWANGRRKRKAVAA